MYVQKLLTGFATFALLLSLSFACAASQDCSKYSSTDAMMCKCIRENGDVNRAADCSRKVSKMMREEAKRDCYRRCYDDCGKCEKI